MPVALSEAQIRAIEKDNPDGVSSSQLVDVFAQQKVRFSEANLRRYVQLGLVPRSRRIGQKGKHLGSRGVYPIKSVRRINTIKKLMAERYTLEEIQAKFLTFKDGIEGLDESLEDLLGLFESKIELQSSSDRKDRLLKELESIKSVAGQLMEAVQRLEKLLLASGGRRPRGGGVASPTELL